MGDYNRVVLCGHLGRDAELRYVQSGDAVATLNLATTETWKDKAGEKQERTEWSRIVVWGKTAENLAQYLTKGKNVLVEGRLQTRQWDDKEGVKRYTTEIKADKVVLLGGARNGREDQPARNDEAGSQEVAANQALADDDIPFLWLLPLILPALLSAMVYV